jgi:hypothetical protein
MGEQNAVQTLGRNRPQAQGKLAASLLDDQPMKLAGQFVNHSLIQLCLA